jgi:hypothetical protein
MRVYLLSLFLFTTAAFGQGIELSLKNTREGKSFYSKQFERRAYKKLTSKISESEVVSLYRETLLNQKANELCSFTLNHDLKKAFLSRLPDMNYENVLYALRKNNELDDVVVKILLNAHEIKSTQVFSKDDDELSSVFEDDQSTSLLKAISNFETRFASKSCFDEAYRNYYADLVRINKSLQSDELEALHYLAFKEKRISEKTYVSLEQGRLNQLELSTLTLSDYLQKLKTLRIQYPLRDAQEKSDFVSAKVKKLHASRRQRLFENYSDIQIILMANVIKKLRSRLEYDAVDILGYKDGVLQETIPLGPMERFRFAIKALRKEMSLLSLNTFFNGRAPDYMDLMVASYEIGLIPASELETVASLEEIWNPKKTFWDKAGIWVRTFSSVATIAIPPPYGFIPALVLVVIEATVSKKKDPNTNDPTSMF